MSTGFRRFVYQHWFRDQNFKKYVKERNLYASKSLELDSTETADDLKHYPEFKKLVKLTKVNYKDGHTCFQLACKLCKKAGDKWAYVNKRTGSFNCPNCDVRVPLLTAKSAYENSKQIVDYTKTNNEYKTKYSANIPVSDSVCNSLQIKGLKAVDMELLNASYIPELNALKFPLKNVAGRIVGENLLHLEDGREESFQNENASGILMHGQVSKQKAILVSNLLDFLVLIAQRIDTRKYSSLNIKI